MIFADVDKTSYLNTRINVVVNNVICPLLLPQPVSLDLQYSSQDHLFCFPFHLLFFIKDTTVYIASATIIRLTPGLPK